MLTNRKYTSLSKKAPSPLQTPISNNSPGQTKNVLSTVFCVADAVFVVSKSSNRKGNSYTVGFIV